MTSKGWHTLRKHFCFLPLQISHFDELPGVGGYLYLSKPGHKQADDEDGLARMTSDGDIVTASPGFSDLALRLREELNLRQAVQIRRAHHQHQTNLRIFATRAAAVAEMSWNQELWQDAWCSIAQAIAELAPYGLVTKILPDILLERSGGLPLERVEVAGPSKSPSEAFPLYLSSRSLVKGVQVLVSQLKVLDPEQPGKKGETRRQAELRSFCERNVGHGSRAWEAPGYEDPRYVLSSIVQARNPSREDGPLTEAVPTDLLCLPDASADACAAPELPREEALAPASGGERGWQVELQYWATHLDLQTSILRWGFLTAELPLIRGLAAHLISAKVILRASDLLFCTRHEIGESIPSHREIDRRRNAYLSLVSEAGRPELSHAPGPRMDPSHAVRPPLAGDQSTPGPKPAQPAGAVPDVMLRGQSVSSEDVRSGIAWPVGPGPLSSPTQSGAVLIARHLTPDLTPALLGAAAVVVEEGGLLQHAAIVAREIGIPCVVGCRGLLERVTRGMRITVDGRDGQVTIRP